MDGSTDAELDVFDSELIDDVFRIAERTGQAIEFGDRIKRRTAA